MEVKILSREMTKPSSPTPSHLKTFKLSLLDQLSNIVYTPLIFFYSNKNDNPSPKIAISNLKKSLSETLRHFYLLAGRIIDRSIDCNDKGALFFEARVDCKMSDFLKEPNFEMLGKILPYTPLFNEKLEENAQIVAQFNTFNCGGIAISFCFLHKLIDGTTMSCFLRSWASINRGSFDSSKEVVCSDYKQLSTLFPQTQVLPFHPQIHNFVGDSEAKNRIQTRRVVFDAKAISDLKMKAKSISVPNPTSVEVVTCFIWKHVMEAASVRLRSQKPSALTHSVNLRKKIQPPLLEFPIGNIFWKALSEYKANIVDVELDELVKLLRQSFEDIDSEYVQKFTGDKGIEAILEFLEEEKELFSRHPNTIMFSSWRNMNLNDVDFGWGKPIWTSIAKHSSILIKNFVFLLDTISKDGIEAWMQLDEDEMKLMVEIPEFLNYALLNPSIPLA